MTDLIAKSKQSVVGRGLRIVMPEGVDPRIREAASQLKEQGIADPIIFGEDVPPPQADDIALILSRREKMNEAIAARLLKKPLYRAGAMVATGEAQAVLAGAANPTARVIEAALMTVGLGTGINTPSSFFLMQWPDKRLVFAAAITPTRPKSWTPSRSRASARHISRSMVNCRATPRCRKLWRRAN
jgi:phosphate acetyltransferase